MKEVERYLDHVCRSLGGSSSLRRHLREELREHLEEAIDAHCAGGMTRDEAAARAMEEFGTPAMVSEGLEAVYGRRLLTVVVEKAMAWKEKTMKTGWKWSFVAHLAVGAVIAAQLALVGLVVTYILPVVQHAYATMNQPLPGLAVSALNFVIFLHHSWWLWVGILAVGGAAFEWLYRGENKSMIRLGMGGGAAFGLMGLLWAVTFASAVPLGMLVMDMQAHPPETLVRLNAMEAEAAYVRLDQALREKDWPGAGDAADRLRDAFRSLEHLGASAPVLTALHRQDDLDRIRILLDRLVSQAGAVREASRDPDPPVLSALFAELEKSHADLVAGSGGWPSVESQGKGEKAVSTGEGGASPPPGKDNP